ncbi:MAG: Spy/CpxP family protein refolding chaperone [Pseudohongiellaceae bacterium]|jgi:hypothetical protein
MLRRWLTLVCAIAGLILPTKSLLSQTADDAELTSWLPRTLNQSLHEYLSKVVDHVTTRAGCINVLEAKVSEEVKQLNPKFIVTCSSMDNTTLNFVYWQSDIQNNFSGITYPEKQEKQIFSVAEQQRLRLLKLRSDNKDLMANCRAHLASKLSDNTAFYADNDVTISQRGEQYPVVYIEYSAGQSEFSLLYTATCRLDISQSIQMTIFPRRKR